MSKPTAEMDNPRWEDLDNVAREAKPTEQELWRRLEALEEDTDGVQCIHKITDRVYLTGVEGASKIKQLQRLGIQHVFSMDWSNDLGPELANAGIQHHRHFIPDSPDQDIVAVADKIHKLLLVVSGNALVHCQMGISRAPSVVIYHIMMLKSIGYEEAFHLVKQQRSFIRPNHGFERALRGVYRPNSLMLMSSTLPAPLSPAELEMRGKLMGKLTKREKEATEAGYAAVHAHSRVTDHKALFDIYARAYNAVLLRQ